MSLSVLEVSLNVLEVSLNVLEISLNVLEVSLGCPYGILSSRSFLTFFERVKGCSYLETTSTSSSSENGHKGLIQADFYN